MMKLRVMVVQDKGCGEGGGMRVGVEIRGRRYERPEWWERINDPVPWCPQLRLARKSQARMG